MRSQKFMALLLIITVVALSLAGCTSEVSYKDDLEDDSPLSIYLLAYNYRRDHFINYYNRMKPKGNRKVHITQFPAEEAEAMYDQMLNEISVGNGPDIIYINDLTHKYMDVNKISKQNTFADMDILIENNGEFDFSQYNTMALDTGIVNGRRIMMPITYNVNYLIGVEECFKNNNLEVPDKLTIDIYLDLIEEYYLTRPNAPAMLGIDPVYLLAEHIKLDQTIEKSNELQRLFEVLKEENVRLKRGGTIYLDDHYHWNRHWNNGHSYDSTKGYYGFFIESNLLFKKSHAPYRSAFFSLYEQCNIINYQEGHMLIFEQPFKDSQTKSYSEEFFAININSKHKNEAFDFVKYMMSKEANVNRMYSSYLPINKEGYKYVKEDMLDGYGYFLSDGPIPNEVQLSQKTVDKIIKYVESAETYEYIGQFQYVYHNVINQCIEDYYKDLNSFDEMIIEMNNKLSIYYTE